MKTYCIIAQYKFLPRIIIDRYVKLPNAYIIPVEYEFFILQSTWSLQFCFVFLNISLQYFLVYNYIDASAIEYFSLIFYIERNAMPYKILAKYIHSRICMLQKRYQSWKHSAYCNPLKSSPFRRILIEHRNC